MYNLPDDILDLTVRHAMKGLNAKLPRQCQHIKSNGEFCGSPALRGRNYCFFHLTHIGRRLRAERTHEQTAQAATPQTAVLELPPLEDANSIQIALMQVIDAILHNRLDTKRAGLTLYALQTASSNLANGASFHVPNGATVVGRYPSFEEDYELGDDAPELKVEDKDEDEDEPMTEAAERPAERLALADEASATSDECAETCPQESWTPEYDEDGKDGSNPEGPELAGCSMQEQFFCSLNGPLAHQQAGGVIRRSEKEALSQRIAWGRSKVLRRQDEIAA
jgi:hypothetical protein